MPGDFETGQALAEVYADGLFQSLESLEQADAVGEEFDGLMAYVTPHADMKAFLTSAAIDRDARRESLRRIFGHGRMGERLLSLLLVLNDRGRLELLAAIHEAYTELLDTKHGRVNVRVTSAVPLTDALRRDVTTAVSAFADRQATLVEHVDSSIIGGVVIEVEDRRVDGSVRRQLADMAQSIRRRGAQELRAGVGYEAPAA